MLVHHDAGWSAGCTGLGPAGFCLSGWYDLGIAPVKRICKSAEKKILKALPRMAKAAQSEDLRAAFEKHETETE